MNNPTLNWYSTLVTDDLDDLKLDFAVAIERALTASGQKRADLARELGVSPSRITAILRGDENLTMEVMHKLATAVGQKISIRISPASAEEPICAS